MAVIGIVIGIATMLILSSVRTERSAADVANRLAVQSALADQFRADVSQAAEAAESLGADKAGPACLILRVTRDEHIVYRWRDGRLERVVVGAKQKSAHPLPVGTEYTSATFGRTDPGRRLITLDLREQRPRLGGGQQLQIAAALGGDAR
jgi:hypothetical protein